MAKNYTEQQETYSPYCKRSIYTTEKGTKRKERGSNCNLRRLKFYIPLHQYIKFTIQLYFDNIHRNYFICDLISLYLERDPDFMKCFAKIKEKNFFKKNKGKFNYSYDRKLNNLINKEKIIAVQIGLTKSERNIIISEIEKYLPEDI